MLCLAFLLVSLELMNKFRKIKQLILRNQNKIARKRLILC